MSLLLEADLDWSAISFLYQRVHLNIPPSPHDPGAPAQIHLTEESFVVYDRQKHNGEESLIIIVAPLGNLARGGNRNMAPVNGAYHVPVAKAKIIANMEE